MSQVANLNVLLGQINPEKSREEFRSASQTNGGSGVKDFMDGMGLGLIADQVNLIHSQNIILISSPQRRTRYARLLVYNEILLICTKCCSVKIEPPTLNCV